MIGTDKMLKPLNKIKVVSIVTIVLLVLGMLIPTGNAGAGLSKTDSTDDICIIITEGNETTEMCNQSIPHLDIVKIVRDINEEENQVVLMIILGEIIIVDDSAIHYIVWYNNSYSKYKMDYSNGVNSGSCYNFGEDVTYTELTDPVVNKNSLTVTYPLLRTDFPNEDIEAAVYQVDGSSLLIDRIPNEKKGVGDDAKPIGGFENPDQNKSSTSSENNTPGFECSILFIGIAMILFLRKKRRIKQ